MGGGLNSRLRSLAEQVADYRRDRSIAFALSRDLRIPAPSAFAAFGNDSFIVPPGRVTCPDLITVGDDVQILEHAWLSVVRAVDGVEPRLTIGDGTRIGRFCHLACVGEITIGRRVLTSERLFIGDTYHSFQDPDKPVRDQPMAEPLPVRIGDGAFLGIGAVVLRGVTVGENAYVGAGSVVTSDVPPRTVAVGNPARPVRRWDDEAEAWISVVADESAVTPVVGHLGS